ILRAAPSAFVLPVAVLVTAMKFPSDRIVPFEFKLRFDTLALGLEKCGVLVRLNDSARTCSFQRSLKLKLRNSPVSRLATPGPRRIFNPVLPKRAVVTGRNASGSKYGTLTPIPPNFVTCATTWSAVWLFPGALREVLDAVTVN